MSRKKFPKNVCTELASGNAQRDSNELQFSTTHYQFASDNTKEEKTTLPNQLYWKDLCVFISCTQKPIVAKLII
jgi:hypothetical protein